MGIDLRDQKTIEGVVAKYKQDIKVVWNLAAPLSIETEKDPNAANDITVQGFKRLIQAMDEQSLPESTMICFSDSIGSYGRSAPRDKATADWLVENPT